MKKVFKYGTGQGIPEGAVYLNTVTQTSVEVDRDHPWALGARDGSWWVTCWLVWHYFLVEVDESGRVVAPPVGGSS